MNEAILPPAIMHCTTLWSQKLPARLLGLSLARESGTVLTADERPRLMLWDRRGKKVAEHGLGKAARAIAMSDDGACAAALCVDGTLWWFDGDLRLRFDQPLGFTPLALAMEALGRYVAVSSQEGRTQLYLPSGKPAAFFSTPRPLHHLAFVPSQAGLVGAADYGYVAAFDAVGGCRWHDKPLSHVGGLHLDGAGNVAMACYSAGVQTYRGADGHRQTIATPDLCRLVQASFDGKVLLVAHETPSLALLNADGKVLGKHPLAHSATALALGALGDLVIWGDRDGSVTALSVSA